MGIYGARFYFKNGLPKINAIKEKFKSITGLNMAFTTSIELKKIVDNAENIIYDLNRSKAENKAIDYKDFDANKSEIYKNTPYINIPYFSCENFNKIYISEHSVEENSFAIEAGICNENRYFFQAFCKTIYELDGLDLKYSIYPIESNVDIEKYLKKYSPTARKWKNIRPWNEMSVYEQNCFNIIF